jgi:hypothetical protein
VNYWITTHWPRREDESVDEPHNGVWVQDGQQQVIDRVAPGDLVFIYESKFGPTVLRQYADGTTKRLRCRQGREGIVALVEVTSKAFESEESRPEQHADGSTMWWRYCAPTQSANSAGFLPRVDAARLLGFSDRYPFRGFGDGHSGLKWISEESYNDIRNAYFASARATEGVYLDRAWRAGFGGGGEGPEHLALKNRIAADPAGVLDEPGLCLWHIEWNDLPTGDRIDVVLRDALDRFVAVEVEVDCDASEMAGPLQCMKYRAMISYFFDHPIEEVRSLLVAHSIDPDVRKRCTKYKIEARTVARQTAEPCSA